MQASEKKSLAKNISVMIDAAWDEHKDKNVMAFTKDETSTEWVYLTGADVRGQVDAVAKGLIAIGVKPGDRVGIMSRTRYEWTVLDFAIWAAGAVPVPIYDTSSPDQIDWITSDSEIRLLFVETREHKKSAESVAQGESPLGDIRVIEAGALEELAKTGVSVPDSELAKRKDLAKPGDLATIMYTSGTTGRPKGVRLTHFSYVRHVAGIQVELHDVLYQEGASTILFLTLAHSLARLVEVVLAATGVVIGFCPDTSRLVPLLGTFKPTLILAVPRVFEKVYNGAEQKAAAAGKGGIFRWAAKQAIDYSKSLDEGGPKAMLKFRYSVAHKLVLHKIVDVLGGNATWAISGSAPLGERMGHFYRGLGIAVLEGYGLTETNAASHVNLPKLSKIGTVGPPLPGVEVKIADDGEILMRGDTLFEGYHHNPEATAEVMKKGWFYTGDIGSEDADGYLTITGRKKEIIVTAGGKNVAPATLEDRFRGHPLVSQCIAVGDGKPFIGMLITLDADALPGWLKAHGQPEMTALEAVEHPAVLESLERGIARTNTAVSRAESIRKFRILRTDLTVMNGYLTPSLKVKRERVLADFKDEIEALYSDKRDTPKRA